MAEAGEGDHAHPGRLGQRGRELAPQPNGSEPLVQQHHRRSVAGEVEDLKAAALELDPRHEQKPAGPAPTIAVLLHMPPKA